MESKPTELRTWKVNNNDTATNTIHKPSIKPAKSESKKVPFTLKYQLNIRKTTTNNNNQGPSSVANSPLPIGAHSGILSDLTFDQDKGQFLWTTEGYQQSKKRRMTNGNSSPKPYDIKVPRPPNAFIIYHRNKSKELAKFKTTGKNETTERHPSKTVAEMWKEESAEIKLQYQREADLALVEHKKKYPFYKYKPKKRDGKNKSKSQNNNNSSNQNNSTMINSSNENNKNDPNNEDDSEGPMQHRKQAAMESAFTVFDLNSNNGSANNNSPPHTPNSQATTPLWADFSPLQLSPPLQQQQQQHHQCRCTAHCVNHHNNNNVNSVTTPLDSLSSAQWDAVLELVGWIAPHNSIATDNIITMPNFSCGADYFPQITAPAQDWPENYVVPSQSTSAVPPPTPTSPVNYLPWTAQQSMDTQFTAANPITNITNVTMQTTEHYNHTNNNLFNDVVFDNFDSNFNFTL